MSDIPEWAVAQSCKEIGVSLNDYRNNCYSEHMSAAIRLLAARIAEHEDPPVDPLLIEARKLVASRQYDHDEEFYVARVMRGDEDDWPPVRHALVALKRGIEIGKSA